MKIEISKLFNWTGVVFTFDDATEVVIASKGKLDAYATMLCYRCNDMDYTLECSIQTGAITFTELFTECNGKFETLCSYDCDEPLHNLVPAMFDSYDEIKHNILRVEANIKQQLLLVSDTRPEVQRAIDALKTVFLPKE